MKNCSTDSHAPGSRHTNGQRGVVGACCTTPWVPLCSPRSLQQLPLRRDPMSWRTHPEPGHSASPDLVRSCGKICSWTQNHTVLEQKPRSNVRARRSMCRQTPALSHVHAGHTDVLHHRHTDQGSLEQLWAGSQRSCRSSGSYFHLGRTHLFAETSGTVSWSAPPAG